MRPTAQQFKLLSFLGARLAASPVAPSYEDMREHMGLASKSGVHRLVGELVARNLLTRERDKPRSVDITDEGKRLLALAPDALTMWLSAFSDDAIAAEYERRGLGRMAA